MDCRDFQRILSARADGEASPEETRASEEHLAACGNCRRSAERIVRLGAAIARTEGEASADFREKLFARLEKEELLPRRRSLFAYSYRWAAIPAALAAGIVVFLLTSRDGGRAPVAPPGEAVRVARQASEAAPELPAGAAASAAREETARSAPAAAPQGASAPDLSQEEREIVANLDILEGTPELEGNGGLEEIELLLPSETDKG